jgi:hypothetical protein
VLMVVPLLVGPAVLVFGAGSLVWDILVNPGGLPWPVWLSVGTVLVGVVLLGAGKYARKDSRFVRVMGSTEHGRFYRIGISACLCTCAAGMLLQSSAFFITGLAIGMSALVIDVLLRTVFGSAKR